MIPQHELTSLPAAVLDAYPCRTFIETGTNTGKGVDCAKAHQPAYDAIWSCERDKPLADAARARFIGHGNIVIWYGGSPGFLKTVLRHLVTRAVIYLDAHTEDHNPLLEELAAIATLPYKEHVILIDDVRMFGHAEMSGWKDVTHAAVSAALQAINPAYTVLFADTVNGERDLLIAAVDHPAGGPGR